MKAIDIRRDNTDDRPPEPLEGAGVAVLVGWALLLLVTVGPWVVEWLR